MRVLVLGSGGRENALYLTFLKSPITEKVYGLPGNGGFSFESSIQASSIIDMNDFSGILKIIERYDIQLVVVGPEMPLASGIKDFFAYHKPKLLVFGPNQASSQLEASKKFAVEYMKKRGIPTAESVICESFEDALNAIQNHSWPLVIKADGLAAGKGVSIHSNMEEAKSRLKEIFHDKLFGKAGEKVVLQTWMQGTEASLFAICNGKEAIYLPGARDYKPAFDDNAGPNTGGMGSFAPSDVLTEEQIAFIHKNITKPILQDFSYTGLLYIGLMVHSDLDHDLSVVEFNCRFGDPETQTILPILETGLLPYMLWSCGHTELVPKVEARGFYHVPYKKEYSVNVVLASEGYPGDYVKDIAFYVPESNKNVMVIHAGTVHSREHSYEYVSTGGRILNIIGLGKSLHEAREAAYEYIQLFCSHNSEVMPKFHFRKDIALSSKLSTEVSAHLKKEKFA